MSSSTTPSEEYCFNCWETHPSKRCQQPQLSSHKRDALRRRKNIDMTVGWKKYLLSKGYEELAMGVEGLYAPVPVGKKEASRAEKKDGCRIEKNDTSRTEKKDKGQNNESKRVQGLVKEKDVEGDCVVEAVVEAGKVAVKTAIDGAKAAAAIATAEMSYARECGPAFTEEVVKLGKVAALKKERIQFTQEQMVEFRLEEMTTLDSCYDASATTPTGRSETLKRIDVEVQVFMLEKRLEVLRSEIVAVAAEVERCYQLTTTIERRIRVLEDCIWGVLMEPLSREKPDIERRI